MAAANPRIHVMHRPEKAGLGKAYLAGFRWALERDYEFVFEMDADFSHDPRFLSIFLDEAKDADLVIGSRYKTGVNVINWPISRLLLSLGANQYAQLDHGAADRGLHRRVQVLSPAGAGGDRFRPGAVQRLFLSDRDELPGLEEGVPPGGDPDRVHRSRRRAEQDEQADRAGGHLDGLVAPGRSRWWASCERHRHLQDDRLGQRFRDARWPLHDGGALAGHAGGHHLRPPLGCRRGRPGDPDAGRTRPGPDDLLELGRLPGRHVRQRGALQLPAGGVPRAGPAGRPVPPDRRRRDSGPVRGRRRCRRDPSAGCGAPGRGDGHRAGGGRALAVASARSACRT